MNLSRLTNKDGAVLIEQLVTLALASILLVIFVTAGVYVNKYLGTQDKKHALYEEAALIIDDLRSKIGLAQEVKLFADSLNLTLATGSHYSFVFRDSAIFRNGKRSTASKISVQSFDITPQLLPKKGNGTILNEEQNDRAIAWLFGVKIRLADEAGNVETIETVIQNDYLKAKFSSTTIQ